MYKWGCFHLHVSSPDLRSGKFDMGVFTEFRVVYIKRCKAWISLKSITFIENTFQCYLFTRTDTFWVLSVIFVVQLAVQQYNLSVVSDDEDHRCVQNNANPFKSTSKPEQYNTWNKSTISHKLLKMDVLTFETRWAVKTEIIKQVTSSWSIFIQLEIKYSHIIQPKVNITALHASNILF